MVEEEETGITGITDLITSDSLSEISIKETNSIITAATLIIEGMIIGTSKIGTTTTTTTDSMIETDSLTMTLTGLKDGMA